jgi:hypothetical protein
MTAALAGCSSGSSGSSGVSGSSAPGNSGGSAGSPSASADVSATVDFSASGSVRAEEVLAAGALLTGTDRVPVRWTTSGADSATGDLADALLASRRLVAFHLYAPSLTDGAALAPQLRALAAGQAYQALAAGVTGAKREASSLVVGPAYVTTMSVTRVDERIAQTVFCVDGSRQKAVGASAPTASGTGTVEYYRQVLVTYPDGKRWRASEAHIGGNDDLVARYSPACTAWARTHTSAGYVYPAVKDPVTLPAGAGGM